MKEEVKKFGHKRFYEILDELAILHSKKNRDYATPEDPLQNFRRVAMWCREYNLITPGHEPMKVAIIYMLKQLDAALKLLRDDEEGRVEGIPERLRDVAVYTLLMEILYGEKNVR